MTVSRRSFLVGAAALMVSPPKIPAPDGRTLAAVKMIADDISKLPVTIFETNPSDPDSIVRENIARMFGTPFEKIEHMDAFSIVQEYEDVVSDALRPWTKQFIESRDQADADERRKDWREIWESGDWMKANPA